MATDFEKWKASWEQMTKRNAFGAVLSMDKHYTEEEFRKSGQATWKKVAPHLPAPCKRILDIGCGAGRVLAYARQHCDTAIGFDISRQMLAIAETRLGRDGYVYTDDLEAVETASIDFIYTVGVFKHLTLEMVQGHVSTGARVLRPGGVCLIHYYSEVPEKFTVSVDETAPDKDDQTPRTNRIIPREVMEQMMDAAGFDVTRSERFRIVATRRGG